MNKNIFIILGILMSTDCNCKRENNDTHKEANLLRAKHILERSEPDAEKRAALLRLPHGADIVQQSMMDLFNCSSENIKAIFNSDGTVNKENVRRLFFPQRVLAQAFTEKFISTMEAIDKNNFPAIHALRELLIKNKKSLDAELTTPQFIKKLNEALVECFSSINPKKQLEKLKKKTGLNEDGTTDMSKYKSIKLEFDKYEEGSVGKLINKFGVASLDHHCYDGQTELIIQASVTKFVYDLIAKMNTDISDKTILVDGKNYGWLKSLLRITAAKFSSPEYLRKNKISEKDEDGVNIERYMTVSEIIEKVMKEKLS